MANGNTPGQSGPDKSQTISCTGKSGPIVDGMALVQCPACFKPLLPGQFFTMIPIGPGPDPHKRSLARSNLPYLPVFLEVHWACVTGDESESRLAL